MLDSMVLGTVYNLFDEEFTSDKDYFAQVDGDIAAMLECGINHVLIFPMGKWNPETRALEWTRSDYLVRRIREAGMKFVPLVLKEEQCFSHIPIWELKKIPELWELHNRDDGGKNNRSNVDFADPRVYPLVERYIRQVVERYRDDPALSFYNIWNEPHYSSHAPHVIEQFHVWLKNRYQDLAGLRRSWGVEYSSWDEISPFLTEDWSSSMPRIDWLLFHGELAGTLLDRLTSSLRSFDQHHPVNANPVGTHWADFSAIGGFSIDQWPIAAREEIVGISYYPDAWERLHNLESHPWWLHNLVFSTVRSAAGKRPFILTELYTYTQNALALNGYVSGEELELLALTALANNCKGMFYWKWEPFTRGRQMGGRGLRRLDGKLGERASGVATLGSIFARHGTLLYEAQLLRSGAGILLDMVGLLKSMEQPVEPLTRNFMYESNAGLFKVLDEANLTPDLLRMDRGLTREQLDQYKLLFLPFQIVVRQEIGTLLADWVERGGVLVADARTAMMDDHDFAYRTAPGAGLDRIFGAARVDWTATDGSYRVNVTGDPGPLSFAGRYFRDEIEPLPGAKVIGRFPDDGSPALIENRYGAGRALLSAVPLGGSYFDRPESGLRTLILRIADFARLRPTARLQSSSASGVTIAVHARGNSRIVYLVNPGERPVKGRLAVLGAGLKIASVEEIISGSRSSFRQRGTEIEFPVTIGAKHALVFLLEEVKS